MRAFPTLVANPARCPQSIHLPADLHEGRRSRCRHLDPQVVIFISPRKTGLPVRSAIQRFAGTRPTNFVSIPSPAMDRFRCDNLWSSANLTSMRKRSSASREVERKRVSPLHPLCIGERDKRQAQPSDRVPLNPLPGEPLRRPHLHNRMPALDRRAAVLICIRIGSRTHSRWIYLSQELARTMWRKCLRTRLKRSKVSACPL